jgi:hypothetical protein
VSGFNFADSYRAAHLAPGPEILRLRQQPFAVLRDTFDLKRALDLTRLFFDLPVPDGTDWFRSAFAETDDSFSMLDNKREVAVLAACLLEAAIEDGHVMAAVATLATAAAGNRRPLVRPELLEHASQALLAQEISNRRTELANLTGQEALPSLTKEAANLREEVDILWWFVGGWSQALQCPFGDLNPSLVPVIAGLDLAYLTRGPKGPAAAPAILQRLLTAGRKRRVGKVTIQGAVDALSPDLFERLQLREELKRVPDICPVLTAFSRAHEIGASPVWHNPFRTASRLEPTSAFQPLALAMQAYRETLLLKQLD